MFLSDSGEPVLGVLYLKLELYDKGGVRV